MISTCLKRQVRGGANGRQESELCEARDSFVRHESSSFLTLTPEKRKRLAAAILSDSSSPHQPSIHRGCAEREVRSPGCHVALDVEGVVGGGVSGEEALGRPAPIPHHWLKRYRAGTALPQAPQLQYAKAVLF